MKEIALIGTNGRVMSAVLSKLLQKGLYVNLLSLNPERVMLENTQLTVTRFNVSSPDAIRDNLEGYSTLVIANETDLENETLDNLILKSFPTTLAAAHKAGAKRIIVVGAKESNAFYTGHLKRFNDIDWVYFDTEGNFAEYVADEIVNPKYHKENASF